MFLRYTLIYFIYLVTYTSVFVFFFFSSRRRHTRCSRDWSSDVCSSDLAEESERPNIWVEYTMAFLPATPPLSDPGHAEKIETSLMMAMRPELVDVEIGRASCRERV